MVIDVQAIPPQTILTYWMSYELPWLLVNGVAGATHACVNKKNTRSESAMSEGRFVKLHISLFRDRLLLATAGTSQKMAAETKPAREVFTFAIARWEHHNV